MTSLVYIRTQYAHWGKHSGYCLLVEAMKHHGQFAVSEIVAGQDISNSCVIAENTWQDCVLPWYTPYDQLIEAHLAEQLSASKSRQIVHFLDGEQGYYYSKRLASSGHKLIATFHQPPGVLYERRLLGNKDQLRSLARAVVLTREQKDYLSRFIDPGRVVIMPHGVDTLYFRPLETKQNNGVYKILSVGFWLRDFEVLAETIEQLSGNQQLEFHVVGLLAGLRNNAVDRQLFDRIAGSKNVWLHDDISDTELLVLYQNASIMAMPLLDGTANNGLLEAAATGLAIVSTELPGVKHMFGESKALLSPPGDTSLFIDNLLRLIDSPSEIDFFGRAARSHMEDACQWDGVAAEYGELYQEVIRDEKVFPVRENRNMRAMCSVITSDYLSQAYALGKSIHANGKTDFFVLISDNNYDPQKFDKTRKDLKGRVELLCLQDLQIALPEYDNEDSVRWALKPPLLLHLLEQRKYQKVIFVDSDVCFFDSYDFLFDKLDTSGVLLTPHWRPIYPDTNPVQFPCNFLHGIYNAGFIGASINGLAALKWWQAACNYRCEKNVSKGYYVDQRYLDLLPVYFDTVDVLRHKGCNVAEWNRDECLRVHADQKTYIENWPVVFVHFSDITISETLNGMDPCLFPLLQKYRSYMDEADKEVAMNGWNLQHFTSEKSETTISERRHQDRALCTVLDFHSVEKIWALLDSVTMHFTHMPLFYVCCADYDSYQLLQTSELPGFCVLMHWSELGSYDLDKQHGLYAGDQHRFTRVCQPFFLNFVIDNTQSVVLFLDCNAVFTQYPRSLFTEIENVKEAYVLPRMQSELDRQSSRRCDYWFVGLSQTVGEEFIKFWISQVVKRREWDKLVVPGVESKFSVKIASWQLSYLSPESQAAEVLFGDKVQHVGQPHTSSECRVGNGQELENLLNRIPQKDIVRAALRQGNDIHNFGRLEGFKGDETVSSIHVAYVLYLIGVLYREIDKKSEAELIFHTLITTKMGMPDLYRSKAYVHLGAIKAEQGDEEIAANMMRNALNHYPGNKEASKWLAHLKG